MSANANAMATLQQLLAKGDERLHVAAGSSDQDGNAHARRAHERLESVALCDIGAECDVGASAPAGPLDARLYNMELIVKP